jgi:phosphopantetheine--protein transferase-like protein
MDDKRSDLISFANSLSSTSVHSVEDIQALPSLTRARVQAWLKGQGLVLTDFISSAGEHVNVQTFVGKTRTHEEDSVDGTQIGIDVQAISAFDTDEVDLRDHLAKFEIFTHREISYCLNAPNWQESIAATFALKEAVYKASAQSVALADLEVSRDKSGRPMVEGYKCSISHDNGLAVAVALKHDYAPGGATADLSSQSTGDRHASHSRVTTSKVIMLCIVTNIALIALAVGVAFLANG